MFTDTGDPTGTPFFDQVTTCVSAVPAEECVVRCAPFAPAGAFTVPMNLAGLPAEPIWNSWNSFMCVLPKVSNAIAVARVGLGPNGGGAESRKTLSGGNKS